MGRPACTRAEDEALLRMLTMRRKHPAPAIGRRFGMRDVAVRVATDRVRRADEEVEGRDLSGEYRFLNNSQAQKARHHG